MGCHRHRVNLESKSVQIYAVLRERRHRLVNELRVAGITALAAANTYLRDVFVPHYN
jgi:hypothetical protein